MGSKESRRGKPGTRNRSIELLEDRRVMSAEPIGQLLGGPIQQHSVEEPPSLVQHAQRDADFWIDSWAERDLDTMLGDVQQSLASAHGSTGLTGVRNDYGFIGAGQTVAIIDSGIAWNHTALGGGLGANYRVVGGWDFTENDANPYDDGPWGSHGTHVAGIVGADRAGTNDDGVASGVDLVGLRVFDDNGDGYFSWVENALQWVHQNRNAFENPITAVNLSLGTSWNSNSVPSWSTLENEFAQLKADGIFVAVSAGNSFATYNAPGLSYPAASPHVVPVMSVDDGGSLSSFSQRHTRAIAAPGRYIVSTVPDYAGNNNGVNDDYASYSGTSMAAPYIAGASVVLREAMQFVGYTNITQDTIYNHMMSTATSFFDAATSQNYKRINLTNAFNALMPGDDYGSTVAGAHDLGSLSGTSEISGLIGKLSDADYFRFTAAATGTVSFTADTTHGLAAVWTASGGTVSGSHGETYSFDVVAGQSYTIGLSTGGGIGYYDLSIEAESVFTYVDWGTIIQANVNGLSNTGESWYRVNASRTGYLTAEAFFTTGGGNIDLALYDANLQLLASGAATASGERVDMSANKGSDYFLRVAGTNSDIDFRLTNLVSLNGATVNVAGTSADDTFTFTVGATQHTVSVNGATYQLNRAAVKTINFTAGAGVDAITMTGSTEADTATLRVGTAQLVGNGYAAVATSVEHVTAHGGGGTDLTRIYGSSGNDNFHAYFDHAVLTGNGYQTTVLDFDRVQAYAGQGTDRAYFYDTAGDDIYGGWSDRAIMYGSGYHNEASNFDRTFAYSTLGNDRAYFYDSAGNDQLVSTATYSSMTGGNFDNYAGGFASTYAYATKGGVDKALLYDSAGNDQFIAAPSYSRLSGSGLYKYVSGFDSVDAYATAGGVDSAIFQDSAGNDQFVARPEYGRLSGIGFNNCAWSFDRVEALAMAGGTDIAYFYDSAGDDLFVSRPEYGRLSGGGFDNYAGGFDRVYAYATAGGNDRSNFYDSVGNDQFVAYPAYARMSGKGFYNYARGFKRTYAYATAGGVDEALLYGSAAGTQWSSGIDFARLSGPDYYNYANGFETLSAFAGDGSTLVNLRAVDQVFDGVGG